MTCSEDVSGLFLVPTERLEGMKSRADFPHPHLSLVACYDDVAEMVEDVPGSQLKACPLCPVTMETSHMERHLMVHFKHSLSFEGILSLPSLLNFGTGYWPQFACL